jgi:hypothetical protein
VRIADAHGDRPGVNVAKVDVPAVLALAIAAAGEYGLLKRGGGRHRLAVDNGVGLVTARPVSAGREVPRRGAAHGSRAAGAVCTSRASG